MAKEKEETILSKQHIHRTKAKLCAGGSGCKTTENNGEVTAGFSAQFVPSSFPYNMVQSGGHCSPALHQNGKLLSV